MRAPRICACGRKVQPGTICVCQVARLLAKAERVDAQRGTAAERGYDARWRRARAEFLNLHPRCAMCDGAASVVDHRTPHRGDDRLFWDRANWQPLCRACHAGPKQRAEWGSTRQAAALTFGKSRDAIRQVSALRGAVGDFGRAPATAPPNSTQNTPEFSIPPKAGDA